MTTGFLAEIVRETALEISRGTYDGLETERAPTPRPSLRGAIERAPRGRGLLAEYKRISPGRKDPALPSRTIDEFLRGTDIPEVVGFSCLAARPRFEGGPAQVAQLARATSRPVLFKDFVIDVRQLRAARSTGASAALLIARLETERLTATPLATLAAEARRLGLEILLELHRPEEVDLVPGVAPDLVGVNVRDLDTLRFERHRAAETFRALRGQPERPLLGLSGVEGPADAEEFWRAGCRAILVGSAVALAPDPAAFLRSLLPPENRA